MATAAAKVRDDLEYFDQVIDGDEVVLVRDPVRNTYFRYNLLQAAMLRALDGQRSPQEIAAFLSEQFEVEIPPEAAERFVARARDLKLLDITSYDVTPEAARKQVRKALRKAGFRERAAHLPRTLSPESALFAEAFRQVSLGHPRAAAGYLAKILADNPNNARAKQLYDIIQSAYIRAGGAAENPTWVVFNPGRLLTWLSRTIGGFLFSWMGVLAMLAFLCLGASAYLHISFDAIRIGPFDVAVTVVTLLAAFMFHELGHGLACQHYGGNVTEIGFMLFYYVQPAAFCDTSSSYTISDRRHKMVIQLAGSIASLMFISAHAIVLALLSPQVAVYSGLALAFVVGSALAFLTLIPFLKNDGYYAICDYTGMPNLRDRSFTLARAWLSERLLGLPIVTEELPARTRRIMIAYAIASFAFTAWFLYYIYFKLLAPVVERFGGAGLFAGGVVSVILLRKLVFRTIWDFARMLIRERRQVFTLRRTAVMVGLLAALIAPWFLRWPVLVDGEFVLVPHQRADVRARTPGRVVAVHVAEGDHVTRGQPLATLRNVELRGRILKLEAELAVATYQRELVRGGARPEEIAVARRRLQLARAEVARSERDATVASQLARAAVGTQSGVDVARGRAAADRGAAGSAKWALSLLEAGARPEDIALVEAEHARIAAELAHLRAEEELLVLRSPIDGVVATSHVEDKLQAMLAAGDLFVEIHDQSAVVAEIPLAMNQPLAEIAPGDTIELRPYGAPHGDIQARVERVREAAEDANGQRRVVVVTSAFRIPRAVTGLHGHARIYGAERSLAYAHLYLPMQRLVSVKLWSMW